MDWFETATAVEPLGPRDDAAALSLDPLLDELRHRRWDKWVFGALEDPVGLAFVLRWPWHADVLVLHDHRHAVAYRSFRTKPEHAFDPEVVAWYWTGEPAHAIRSLLTLPPPGALNAPCDVLRDLAAARVPATWLATRPTLIRPSQ